MGLFRRATPMDAAEVARLKAEIGAMKTALDAHRDSTTRLAERLDATPTHAAMPSPTPAEVPESLASLVARVEEVMGQHSRLDTAHRDLDTRLAEFATKLGDLDARISSVSTELTNQLTELGHDIDALSSAPGGAVDEAALGEIRDGQVRLASEQARYQIAFRDDLARLAEQLRRPPPT